MFDIELVQAVDTVDKEYWQSDHTDWWYHRPRTRGGVNISPSWLLKNVDPQLAGSVKLLLEYRIPTAPSCSGHQITPQKVNKIWNSLQQDAHLIRRDGIILTNCESGEQEEFCQPDWRIPFTQNDFHWRLMDLTIGYLGLVLPVKRVESFLELSHKLPTLVRIEKGREISPGFNHVLIFNENPSKVKSWTHVENILRQHLYNERGDDRMVIRAAY